jgi:hypothetical protein
MNDAGGDGWNGVSLSIRDSNSTLLYDFTMSSGYTDREWVCLVTGCYQVVVNTTSINDSSEEAEISWIIEVTCSLSLCVHINSV